MSAAISWINWIEPGLTVALGGTATTNAVDPAFPATNLLDPDPSLLTRVATTEDATTSGQYLRVDLGQDRTVRVMAALNVPLDNPAALHASGIWMRTLNSTPTVDANGTAFAETTVVQIPGTDDDPRYNLFWLLDSDRTAARYVDLIIQLDALQTLNWGAGHLWAGPALVLPDGLAAAWTQKPLDPSPVKRGQAGGYAARKLPHRMRLSAPVSSMPYATAMGDPTDLTAPSFRQFSAEAGVSSPVLILPRTSSQHVIQTTGMYGLLTDTPAYPHQVGDQYDASFEAEQIR